MAFIGSKGLSKPSETVHAIDRRYIGMWLITTKSQFKAPCIRPYAITTFIKVWLGCT